MNSLLLKLQRWQMQAKPVHRANHWTRWADQLQQRYGLVRSFHPSNAFAFVHPVTLRMYSGQQEILQGVTFAPRINLSIGTILKEEILRNSQNTFWPSPTLVKHPGTESEHNGLPIRQIPNHTWYSESNVLLHNVRVEQHSQIIPHNKIPQHFQDISRRILTKNSMDMVLRLRSEKQRIETIVYGSVTQQLRRSSSVMAFEQGVAAASTPNTVKASEVVSPSQRNTQNMPAVNINDLTEQVIRQIDKKMIAHRERMGKVY